MTTLDNKKDALEKNDNMKKNGDVVPGANGSKDTTTNTTTAPESEEDKALVETLDMLIGRLEEKDLHSASIEALRNQIKSSSVSLTSIPKALKFLRARFPDLVSIYAKDQMNSSNKAKFADILSIIGMCSSNLLPIDSKNNYTENLRERPALYFRLCSDSVGGQNDIADWGHEYVRHISMEMMEEFLTFSPSAAPNEAFLSLGRRVALFFFAHSAEPDACDLLHSLRLSSEMPELAKNGSLGDHERCCLYLLSCAPYEKEGEQNECIRIAHDIYIATSNYPQALLLGMRLGDRSLIEEDLVLASKVSSYSPLHHHHHYSHNQQSADQSTTFSSKDLLRQLCFMLARQRIAIDLSSSLEKTVPSEEICVLETILNNTYLTDHFARLAKDLQIEAPKLPEDVYKSHLLGDTSRGGSILGSSTSMGGLLNTPRLNLATSIVNGFLNAAHLTDSLLTGEEILGGVGNDGGEESKGDESKSWIYRCKGDGMMSAVASIGLIHLWNADTGLAALDRYLYSSSIAIKAGAILGIGLVHSGVRTESDPALALLNEYLLGEEEEDEEEEEKDETAMVVEDSSAEQGKEEGNGKEEEGNGEKEEEKQNKEKVREGKAATENTTKTDKLIKSAVLAGLALAYGGSMRDDISIDVVAEGPAALLSGEEDIQTAAMAALTIGHVHVGSGNGHLASAIIQAMMERPEPEKDLCSPWARLMSLGLALLYYGRPEQEAEVILETLQATLGHLAIGEEARCLVKICSYAGSGNVIKIQELLGICTAAAAAQSQSQSDDPSTATVGSGNANTFAVLGIALISMMEDTGREMSLRLFSHLMHFGSADVRKAVPLALALQHVSNPVPAVVEILGKYSHDHEKAVAVNSAFGLGLVAAGTNNAKCAQMLRQLAAYYQRDQECLFMVRIAQGLVHAAKGTITMSPAHSNRLLTNPSGMAGLLTVLLALTEAQEFFLGDSSGASAFLFYFLVPSMYPRFLVTLDVDSGSDSLAIDSCAILVRVGQAVEVVGQAGKPRSITGFQTHSTPVLLASQERAEIASEEWTSISQVMENFVLVKKNQQ